MYSTTPHLPKKKKTVGSDGLNSNYVALRFTHQYGGNRRDDSDQQKAAESNGEADSYVKKVIARFFVNVQLRIVRLTHKWIPPDSISSP
jgi:hypothetical protein